VPSATLLARYSLSVILPTIWRAPSSTSAAKAFLSSLASSSRSNHGKGRPSARPNIGTCTISMVNSSFLFPSGQKVASHHLLH
jgi:hypothetical protein